MKYNSFTIDDDKNCTVIAIEHWNIETTTFSFDGYKYIIRVDYLGVELPQRLKSQDFGIYRDKEGHWFDKMDSHELCRLFRDPIKSQERGNFKEYLAAYGAGFGPQSYPVSK